MITEVLILGLLALLILVIYLYMKLSVIRASISSMATEMARNQFDRWRSRELERARAEIERGLRAKYEAELNKWIQEKEKQIREDAIKRSLSVTLGKVAERIAPIIASYEIGADPTDFRYLGSPVDYVVFKGLAKGEVEEVIFLEVKASEKGALSSREKEVKKAVESGKVRYVVYNIREKLASVFEESAENSEARMQQKADRRKFQKQAFH